MIPVTKPFLPSRTEFDFYLDGIWRRNWLTNNGPLVNEFEMMLKKHLAQKHLLFLSNGTIALQIAIKALGLTGEILTTPFSYVATTSSIAWEGCEPVFVDIDSASLNLDPNKIEASITPRTSAILATHCFGNACDIEAIRAIAERYRLKVIYDGAHCFGTKYNGESIFSYGDISTLSLHSTKLVHSIEGGAVFTQDPELLKKMAYMRNFGHDGPERFFGIGINGKNSEVHAAMGLCVLGHAEEILAVRKRQCIKYDLLLERLEVRKPVVLDGCSFNYAYYPIIFNTEQEALRAKAALEMREIFPRRYFYPSLSGLGYLNKQSTPISDHISSAILCLPLFHELDDSQQEMIARILLRVQNYGE